MFSKVGHLFFNFPIEQCMMVEFWILFESYLWDVFDVNPDVDNCWTLGWQFELDVVLGHTDALGLKREPLRKEEDEMLGHTGQELRPESFCCK